MDIPPTATLLRLSNTQLNLEPAQDVRGYTVKDAQGQDVGHVEDLLIDDTEKRVRFLLVAEGGFLGIGEERFLIPVDAITKVGDKEVHISHRREDVASAPRYNPQLSFEKQRAIFPNLFAYYGFLPFWSAGYSYPGFPYYV